MNQQQYESACHTILTLLMDARELDRSQLYGLANTFILHAESYIELPYDVRDALTHIGMYFNRLAMSVELDDKSAYIRQLERKLHELGPEKTQ